MSEPDTPSSESAAGFHRRWPGREHGQDEVVTFRWEHGGWTIEGRLDHAAVDYVMRLAGDGEVRQFMLFRDLDEPDLWLAHDGRGTWAEVNGAARPDLDGCSAVGPSNAMLLLSLPIRRVGVWAADDERFTARLGVIDVETLGVVAHDHHFVRQGPARWSIGAALGEPSFELIADVDEDFLIVEGSGSSGRLPPGDGRDSTS